MPLCSFFFSSKKCFNSILRISIVNQMCDLVRKEKKALGNGCFEERQLLDQEKIPHRLFLCQSKVQLSNQWNTPSKNRVFPPYSGYVKIAKCMLLILILYSYLETIVADCICKDSYNNLWILCAVLASPPLRGGAYAVYPFQIWTSSVTTPVNGISQKWR